jgi:hypothetical protein
LFVVVEQLQMLKGGRSDVKNDHAPAITRTRTHRTQNSKVKQRRSSTAGGGEEQNDFWGIRSYSGCSYNSVSLLGTFLSSD